MRELEAIFQAKKLGDAADVAGGRSPQVRDERRRRHWTAGVCSAPCSKRHKWERRCVTVRDRVGGTRRVAAGSMWGGDAQMLSADTAGNRSPIEREREREREREGGARQWVWCPSLTYLHPCALQVFAESVYEYMLQTHGTEVEAYQHLNVLVHSLKASASTEPQARTRCVLAMRFLGLHERPLPPPALQEFLCMFCGMLNGASSLSLLAPSIFSVLEPPFSLWV
jgi:hypothetical protein